MFVAADASGGFDYWTVVPSLIGAVAVVGGWTYWLATRRARALRAERDDRVAQDVSEMSDSIDRLGDVVAALAQEAQLRRPQIVARFVTSSGPSPSLHPAESARSCANKDLIELIRAGYLYRHAIVGLPVYLTIR
jgi:hypothetical protein